MARAKRYKVILQRHYTVEVSAENELEARAHAISHASGQRGPEFQQQILVQPRSKPIQPPKPIGDEWCAVEVAEIGPDDHES
jgi:hypothetical protein